MRRNICFVELKRNEFGLVSAMQSLETACIRDYLQKCDVKSSVYIEESMPSINDTAEDILSLSEDVIIFVVHKECEALTTVLVNYIMDLEDVEVCVISDNAQLEFEYDVTLINKEIENKLVSMYGNTEKEGEVSVSTLSPYEDGMLLTRDYIKHGIWLGNKVRGLRSIDVVKKEIDEVLSLYGQDEEQKKFVSLQGLDIDDENYIEEVLKCVESKGSVGAVFVLPVTQKILSYFRNFPMQLANVQFNIQFANKLEAGELEVFSSLAAAHKIHEVKIPAEWITKEDELLTLLVKEQKAGILNIKPYGSVDGSKISDEVKQSVLTNTMKQYYTFYNGYLKSRTGLYSGVKIDGYVHHLEAGKLDSLSNIQLLNETLSINSSIYLREEKNDVSNTTWVFDKNGIAYLEDENYNGYVEHMLENNINPSNLLILNDNKIYVNNYAYVVPSDFISIPYKEAKKNVAEMKERHQKDKRITYLIQLKDKEDYEIFLEDAISYRQNHTFEDLPLIYGFLENSCRFVTQNRCGVEKLPRIKLDNGEGIHFCDIKIEVNSKNSNSLFELSQDCLVKKEGVMLEKSCYDCPSSSWCAKCMELPDFLKNDYCEIIKKKAYILDYVTASYIYSGLIERNPRYFDLMPNEITVSNEYMFNLIPSTIESKVAPYFPKFTTLFICRDSYLLWTPVSTKYYNVSKQFAIVIELLLKRVEADRVPELLAGILNVNEEESYKMTESIFGTLKRVGVLYRDIPFTTK